MSLKKLTRAAPAAACLAAVSVPALAADVELTLPVSGFTVRLPASKGVTWTVASPNTPENPGPSEAVVRTDASGTTRMTAQYSSFGTPNCGSAFSSGKAQGGQYFESPKGLPAGFYPGSMTMKGAGMAITMYCRDHVQGGVVIVGAAVGPDLAALDGRELAEAALKKHGKAFERIVEPFLDVSLDGSGLRFTAPPGDWRFKTAGFGDSRYDVISLMRGIDEVLVVQSYWRKGSCRDFVGRDTSREDNPARPLAKVPGAPKGWGPEGAFWDAAGQREYVVCRQVGDRMLGVSVWGKDVAKGLAPAAAILNVLGAAADRGPEPKLFEGLAVHLVDGKPVVSRGGPVWLPVNGFETVLPPTPKEGRWEVGGAFWLPEGDPEVTVWRDRIEYLRGESRVMEAVFWSGFWSGQSCESWIAGFEDHQKAPLAGALDAGWHVETAWDVLDNGRWEAWLCAADPGDIQLRGFVDWPASEASKHTKDENSGEQNLLAVLASERPLLDALVRGYLGRSRLPVPPLHRPEVRVAEDAVFTRVAHLENLGLDVAIPDDGFHWRTFKLQDPKHHRVWLGIPSSITLDLDVETASNPDPCSSIVESVHQKNVAAGKASTLVAPAGLPPAWTPRAVDLDLGDGRHQILFCADLEPGRVRGVNTHTRASLTDVSALAPILEAIRTAVPHGTAPPSLPLAPAP